MLAEPLNRTPAPPAAAVWKQAVDDYRRGMVIAVHINTDDGRREVHLTRTFQKAWSTLGFTGAERVTVNTAVALIAADLIFPMLSTQPIMLAREPLGARMASPLPGVTLTWQPHWARPDAAVMMTLDRRR